MTLEVERPLGAENSPAAVVKSNTPRRLWRGVAMVCALQVATLGWFLRVGWFFVDDFLFFSDARSPGPIWPFLRKPLFEHFSPVHRLVDLIFFRLFGLSWLAAALVLLALAVACTIAFARLAAALIADTAIVIAVTALYAMSLFFARNVNWWTGGTHLFLLTLASLISFDGFVRWVQSRRVSNLVVALAGYAFALLTHEQAMLLPCFLLLFRLLWLDRGPARVRRWASIVWRELPVWLAYGVLTVAALTNFLLNYYVSQDRPTMGQLVRFLWVSLAEGFIPTLALVKIPEAQLRSPTITVAVGVGLAILGIGFTIATRRRATRGWLFFAASFLLAVVPLGAGRIAQFGVNIGREPRYQMAPAFLVALVLGLVLSEERRVPSRSHPLAAHTRRWPVAVVIGLYLVLALRALPRVAVAGEAKGPRQFFRTFGQDVQAARSRGTEPVFFGRTVPDNVVPAWLSPLNQYAFVLPLVDAKLRVDDGRAAFVIDETGRLVRVTFAGSRALLQPAGTGCSPITSGRGVDVDLNPVAAGDGLILRVRSTADGQAVVRVLADDGARVTASDHSAPMARSTFFSYIPLTRVVHIQVELIAGGPVCVDEIALGFLHPAP